MVVNVIKTFRPGIQAFLLEIHGFLTEAAPESRLTITADTATFNLLLDEIGLGYGVFFLDMFLEGLAAVTNFGAGAAFRPFFVAAPGLKVEVLGVLVPFPVVFAAEVFVAF